MFTTIRLSAALTAFLLLFSVPASANVIAFDTFDDSFNLNSFSAVPDQSATDGYFSDAFDVFGVTDRAAAVVNGNTVLLDEGGADDFGILSETKSDKLFVVQDSDNPDNTEAISTAEWNFDISSGEDLSVCIDIAAMGDFDEDDRFGFVYSIDNGPILPLFLSSVNEQGSLLYTLSGGVENTLSDPLSMSGTTLNNTFQTLTRDLSGQGDALNITFSVATTGNDKVFVFDNVIVKGTIVSGTNIAPPIIPIPSVLLLLTTGLGMLYGIRRR